MEVALYDGGRRGKKATDNDVDERSGVKHSRLLQRPAAAGSLKEHRVVQCLGSSLMQTGRFLFFCFVLFCFFSVVQLLVKVLSEF